MPDARHRDVPVVKEHPRVQLGRVVAALADLQVDGAVAQRLRIAVELRDEADTHVRRDVGQRGHDRAGQHFMNDAAARIVNVAVSVARSTSAVAGRSTARASLATACTRSRNAVACGVGTSLRPARTSS